MAFELATTGDAATAPGNAIGASRATTFDPFTLGGAATTSVCGVGIGRAGFEFSTDGAATTARGNGGAVPLDAELRAAIDGGAEITVVGVSTNSSRVEFFELATEGGAATAFGNCGNASLAATCVAATEGGAETTFGSGAEAGLRPPFELATDGGASITRGSGVAATRIGVFTSPNAGAAATATDGEIVTRVKTEYLGSAITTPSKVITMGCVSETGGR